jgi:hypothetical protein
MIVNSDKVEYLSLLLSLGEERDPSRYLTLRSVSWAVLKRIWVLA